MIAAADYIRLQQAIVRLEKRLDLAEAVIYLAALYRKAVKNAEPRRAFKGQDLDRAIDRYRELKEKT